MNDQQPINLHDLYPHFTDEQLKEAEANLERYLGVMMRIVERLRAEGYDLTAPNLTAPEMHASIPDAKVESPTNITNHHRQP
jgi:hypothetical protein